MTNVSEWAVAAGDNDGAPPAGAPEQMLPGKVNDTLREVMAALARHYQDANGALVLAGGTTAYTLTTNNVHASLADIPMMAVRVNAANTGAMTLAVDGLAAKSVVKAGGTALASGDLAENQLILVAYNPNQDRFEIMSQLSAAALLALLLTVDGAGSGLDADLLDGSSSAAYAKVANNLSDLANAATAFANIKQAATDAATGVVELATVTETKARSDTGRAVTPAGLADFARIKTGSYVGDGSTSQSITGVGFTPKYVKIWEREPDEGDTYQMVETTAEILDDHASGGSNYVTESGTPLFLSNMIIAFGADGFTVDDGGDDGFPNTNGLTFNYLAIG